MGSNESSNRYDLIVIGGGPAGYVAAIRASQLGMKVACIEKEKALGGTCLRVGCIPSKALLDSSEHYEIATKEFKEHGIEISQIKLNVEKMLERKNQVVSQLTQGIAGLFKKNKITWIKGFGVLKNVKDEVKEIQVGSDTYQSKWVLLATGSAAVELPFMKFQGDLIGSSTEALQYKKIPKHLVVVGAGVIGLELGSVWRRVGSKVTVIEFQNGITPGMDIALSKELLKILKKQGMEFLLGKKCLGAIIKNNEISIQYEDQAGGNPSSIKCDKVLVAVGRRPYTDNLALEEAGIQKDDRGRVMINEQFQTSQPGIYAVGDIVAGPMLAHKAEEEGIAAVEILAGQSGHVNYHAIPSVVYTWPEVASVGLTEEELKAKGTSYRSGKFPFMANGRARASNSMDGFVKILADKTTDQVLGVHIIGPRASELISEAVTVIEYGGSAEDIARTCHAHPTLSEVVKEAALDVDNRKINL